MNSFICGLDKYSIPPGKTFLNSFYRFLLFIGVLKFKNSTDNLTTFAWGFDCCFEGGVVCYQCNNGLSLLVYIGSMQYSSEIFSLKSSRTWCENFAKFRCNHPLEKEVLLLRLGIVLTLLSRQFWNEDNYCHNKMMGTIETISNTWDYSFWEAKLGLKLKM